jgi:hypothetical protein
MANGIVSFGFRLCSWNWDDVAGRFMIINPEMLMTVNFVYTFAECGATYVRVLTNKRQQIKCFRGNQGRTNYYHFSDRLPHHPIGAHPHLPHGFLRCCRPCGI